MHDPEPSPAPARHQAVRERSLPARTLPRDIYAGKVTNWNRCEVGTTEDLLTRVNDIDGAIGYAELGTSRKFPAVVRYDAVDGVVPDQAKVADRTYNLWEVEYASTWSTPRTGSLTKASVDHLVSEKAAPVLTRDGLVPCADLPAGFCA